MSKEAEDCEYSAQWGLPVTCPVATVTGGPSARALTTKIEQNTDNSVNKPLPYFIGLAVLATAGACFGILAKMDAGRAERETRMLEYYLLELDAKVIAAGIKTENESIAKKLEKERKR